MVMECQCPKCGRLHKSLLAGKPPASISGLSREDLQYLSRVFNQHADIGINQPGYRVNEWLKHLIDSDSVARSAICAT
jgi:hypothetical protein